MATKTLVERLLDLLGGIGPDIKAMRLAIGDLTTLDTTAKGNLVAAINEIHAALSEGGATINDAAGAGVTDATWSASKILAVIEAAKTAVKNDLTAGASAALDTLAEFAAAINNDPTFAASMATALSNRVRFDAAQVLTAAQQAQACENLGIGGPDIDLLAAYNAAKA